MNIDYEKFMKIAIEEAKISLRKGNKGFGSVIVYGNKIIASAHDENDNNKDMYAEINVINKADNIIGNELENCIIVSTFKPNDICVDEIILKKINTVVYGYSKNCNNKIGKTLKYKENIKKQKNNINVINNVLFEECSYLYNIEIRNEIEKLRECNDDILVKYNGESTKKRKEWFEKNIRIEKLKTNDIKENAYNVFLKKLAISNSEAKIIERTDKKIVFHSKNFCPTLEACKILNLDTRHICKLYNEKSTDALIKQIDKRLKFKRNYEKLRPYTEYCEEMIILEK